jgi:hypothetical protein
MPVVLIAENHRPALKPALPSQLENPIRNGDPPPCPGRSRIDPQPVEVVPVTGIHIDPNAPAPSCLEGVAEVGRDRRQALPLPDVSSGSGRRRIRSSDTERIAPFSRSPE